MRIGSLCTGYGGLDMAAQAVFGGELEWWSDIEPGPIKLMEYHHPDIPNLGDLKEVDWFGVPGIDILTAGYPCQPFSNAGKRLGTEDPRHIWPWIANAVGVLRPRIVLLENVAAHLRRGFDVVSADLADLGYSVAWGIVSAAEAGAPHLRKRLYVIAVVEDSDGAARDQRGLATPGQAEGRWPRPDVSGRGGMVATYSASERRAEGRPEPTRQFGRPDASDGSGHLAAQDWVQYTAAIQRWERILGIPAPEPTVIGARGGRVLSPYLPEWMMGVPGRITSVPGLSRAEQIKLAGNGVVPQQAELAIRQLLKNLEENE